MSDLIVLSSADLLGLLTPAQTVALVETAALATLAPADSIVPQRQHVRWEHGTLLTMPAIGGGALAVKLVSVVPGNAARGLPVTNGIMILADATTGLPCAIMDAATLTAMRTGAVGALGVKHLSPAASASVGIVGTGVQGAWQAISACGVRPIREVFALQRAGTSLDRFRATLAAHVPGVPVTACASAAELLTRTDLIVTATTSAEPVLPDEPRLLSGKHFIAVGSYERHMRELPDAVLRLAGHLVLDSDAARHEVGEAVRPVEQAILGPADLFTIGELIAGRRTVDLGRTTAFKSAGMALYDLYVASALHEAARRRGVGQAVTLRVSGE